MSSAFIQSGNHYTAQGNINITANQTSIIAADKRSLEKTVADWLFDIAVVNHYAIQAETYAKVAPGTASWITDRPEFKDWMSGQLKTLWGAGISGAGKTVLTSSVIHHLEELFDSRKSDEIVLFTYCRFNDNLTMTKIFASLLGQLVKKSSSALSYTHDKFYTTCMDKKTIPGEDDLCTHLRTAIALVSARVFIAIDALDELQDSTREGLLNVILTFKCSIFFTSREISLAALSGPNIRIHAPNKDFSCFITHEVKKLPKISSLLEKRQDVLEDIIQQMMAKSDGMFLLAALQLSALRGITNIKNLRKAVNTLPTTLEAMYQSNLNRILNQEGEEHILACKAILWVTHAARPLRVHELLDALALDPDSTELDPDALTNEQTLVSVCCGLLTIEKKTDTVRLIHYTTYDFFSFQASKLWDLFAHPHTYAATICAVYLQLFGIYDHNLSDYNQLREAEKSHPFAYYACTYLGHHTSCSTKEQHEAIPLPLSNHLLKNSHVLLAPLKGMNYRPNLEYIHYGSIIHFGALHGIASLIQPNELHLNPRSRNGNSPLFYAIVNDHVSIVKYLLDATDIDVNERFSVYRTPLLVLASYYGYKKVVQLLVDHPAINVNAQEDNGNAKIDYGWTALHWASEQGHVSVVELLLGHSAIDVNVQSERGSTASQRASLRGHASIVKLLLGHPKFNVNAKDKSGWTVLYYASNWNCAPIVELLLGNPEINVNAQATDGWTSLLIASMNGYASVVELLLGHPEINVNAPEKDGWTALIVASLLGHAPVVELLLGHPAINVNAQDSNGDTALHSASTQGHKAIVKQLIQHPSIDVNTQTNGGKTALQGACATKHSDVVEILLGHSLINVNIQDDDGDTALHGACIKGHTSAVQLLLGHPAISINIQNKNGDTPLDIASRNSHDATVQLLSG